jgi:cell wall-associated NlpC family hydrolase
MRFPRTTAAIAVSMMLAATAARAAPGGAAPASAAPAAAADRLLEVDTVQLPERIVRTAFGFLGAAYARGGTGGTGSGPGSRVFDCSGLVYRTFLDAAAIELPRSVSGLLASGRPAGTPLHVGDILFFDTLEGGPKGTPDHVGIYAGAGTFVHSASEGPHRGVTVSSLDQEYYRSRFTGARRLLAWSTPSMEIDITDATAIQPSSSELRAQMPSGTPLRLQVACEREGGRFVVLTVFHDGLEAFRRRLRAGPEAPGTAIIVPGPGEWLVTVDLPGGQELAAVRFTAGE